MGDVSTFGRDNDHSSQLQLIFPICKAYIVSILESFDPTNRNIEKIGVQNLDSFIDDVLYIIRVFDPIVNRPSSVSAADHKFIGSCGLSTSTIYKNSVSLRYMLTVAKEALDEIEQKKSRQLPLDITQKIKYYDLLQECYEIALVTFQVFSS